MFVCPIGGNQDGKFSVGFRTGVVRTVVGLDRETQASYRLVIEAIGEFHIGVKTIGYACVSAHVVWSAAASCLNDVEFKASFVVSCVSWVQRLEILQLLPV